MLLCLLEIIYASTRLITFYKYTCTNILLKGIAFFSKCGTEAV